jgi:hypothetical protein
VSIRTEIEGLPIFADVGAFFVVRTVDGGSEVPGRAPASVGLSLGNINIKPAKGTFAVAGEIQALPVFAEAGHETPSIWCICSPQFYGRKPPAIFKPAVIQVPNVVIIVIQDHFGAIVGKAYGINIFIKPQALVMICG